MSKDQLSPETTVLRGMTALRDPWRIYGVCSSSLPWDSVCLPCLPEGWLDPWAIDTQGLTIPENVYAQGLTVCCLSVLKDSFRGPSMSRD